MCVGQECSTDEKRGVNEKRTLEKQQKKKTDQRCAQMKRRMCVTRVGVCVGVQVGGADAASHRGPDEEEQTTNSVRHSGTMKL